MNAPHRFTAQGTSVFEPDDMSEARHARAHLASLPAERRSFLFGLFADPKPYRIHPDRLAQLEREWSDTPA